MLTLLRRAPWTAVSAAILLCAVLSCIVIVEVKFPKDDGVDDASYAGEHILAGVGAIALGVGVAAVQSVFGLIVAIGSVARGEPKLPSGLLGVLHALIILLTARVFFVR